jgi:hypothetical protein
MKSRLVLASTWLTSEPNRLHAIIVGSLVLLGIFASVAPDQVALAGSAPGGSR